MTQHENIEIQVDKHITPNYQPRVSVKTLWSLGFNSLVVTFSSGLVTQLLSYMPVTASLLPVVPQVVFAVVMIIAGGCWLMKNKPSVAVVAYAVAVVAGVLIGV